MTTQSPLGSTTLRTAGPVRRAGWWGWILFLLSAAGVFAGTSGSTNLYTPGGAGRPASVGDFLTPTAANGGLNTFYRYWIEVPPGLARLRIQVFDADILQGAGENAAGRDYDDGTATVTTAIYTVLRPDGTTAGTPLTCDNSGNPCAGRDNAWSSILDSSAPADLVAGHWELRVDMRSSATGDDINAIGIRADDGDETAAGTELNVYVDTFTDIGVNPGATTNTRTYVAYPYVSSGCTFSENDFDYDVGSGTGNGPGGTFGQVDLTSRSGAVTRQVLSANLSANNTWDRNVLARWGNDNASSDYGLWTLNQRISNTTSGGTTVQNYADLYYSNDQAAANPPAANPSANAFRLYLPTDGGAKPAKAYVEQFIACIPASACGVNPAVGVARDYRITIRLVNPSGAGGGTITFSNTNLVTARVPGGAVRYQGQATITNGSIVSQPAINAAAADDVEWNPGSIAAGTTALLTYVIRVTPAAAGRTVVTGTPAANGTRATWLDHTGNASQARATFSTGGICELAISTTALTPAVVSGFAARPAARGVEVEWTTASEVGTASFDLLRFDRETRSYERVNAAPLPALVTAPQGGSYRFADREAPPYGLLRYQLVERTADGGTREHGPYRVLVEERRGGSRPEKGGDGSPFRSAAWLPAPAPLPVETETAAEAGPSRKILGVAALQVGVRETGLYRISLPTLASRFGLSPSQAQALVAQRGFRLTLRGVEIPWLESSDGILFYGRALDSPFSRDAVYRLARAAGAPMAETGAGNPLAPAAEGSFAESARAERDLFAATLVASDPDSDYWFWDYLIAGDAVQGTKSFPLDLPGLAAGATRLTVRLYGATKSGVAGEHRATVRVNGSDAGAMQWTGLAPQSGSFDLPAGVLRETGNSVEISGAAGGGAPQSIVYVDGFEVSYPRRLRASGDALEFQAGTASPLTVGGFASKGVTLLDVTRPDQPRRVSGAHVSGTSETSVTFVPASPSARYFAAGSQAIRPPAWLRTDLPSQLRLGKNGADYLVVTSAPLLEPANDLAGLRSAQGLAAKVVDIQDVYDEFNDGIPSPHALRDFLAFAALKWSPAPRYVVLAGGGNYDYRDLLELGGNAVPPLMAATSAGGLFASDYGFLPPEPARGPSRGGSAGVSIGRIPAADAAALQAYVDKLRAYEEGPPEPWASRALLVADSAGTDDFAAESETVAASLPARYGTERIYLGRLPISGARSQILSALADGVGVINYVGHGALDRLSSQGLLTSADVPALRNGSRAPLLTAFTCVVNRFEVPGFQPFGAALATAGNGGAMAVFAPTGLNEHAEGRALGEIFYRELGRQQPGERLGDAVRRALAAYLEGGGSVEHARIYSLLGDPALLLRDGATPDAGGAGGGLGG